MTEARPDFRPMLVECDVCRGRGQISRGLWPFKRYYGCPFCGGSGQQSKFFAPDGESWEQWAIRTGRLDR